MKRTLLLIFTLTLFLQACQPAGPPAQTTPVEKPIPTGTAKNIPSPISPTNTSPPPEPPTESPSASPTLPTEPTRPPLAPATPAANPIPRVPATDPVVITWIRMVRPLEGWAIGEAQGPDDHLLRTADGGSTWFDVTPPEAASGAGAPGRAAHAAVLDENHAWVVFTDRQLVASDDHPLVWSTSDGGETWTASSPLDTDVFYEPTAMEQTIWFVDPMHGWLMENLHDAGMQRRYINLYRTLDGGLTWERIVDPYSGELQAAGKNALAFADGQNGIATFEQGPYVRVYITWTADGGRTWAFQELPEFSPGALDENYCDSRDPHYFNPNSLIFGVRCRTFDDWEGGIYTLYRTEDAGTTWMTYPYPGGVLQFLTPDLGWALGKDIHRSLDGGQT